MNVEELVRDALHEQAAEQQPLGPDFAHRVLATRRRRRMRALAATAATTAAVVAVAVAVPLLDSGGDHGRDLGKGTAQGRSKVPGAGPTKEPDRGSDWEPGRKPDDGSAPLASQQNHGDVIAHTDQSPPRDLIAAGGTALAAYYTSQVFKFSAEKGTSLRTYRLLDQQTGRYVKDARWAYVAVAPGMRTAAVLERLLPVKRIGLLDLRTGKVGRWIPVDHPVGGLAFSPDGRKLVATTYAADPDLTTLAPNDADGDGKRNDWFPGDGKSTRTGFSVIDVASGKGSWRPVTDPGNRIHLAFRRDFAFSADGTLVWSGRLMKRGVDYYDFAGHKVAAPASEKYRNPYVVAGISPNGRLDAGEFAGEGWNTASAINDPRTGKQVYKVPGQQLLAWADDKRLVAWDIAADGKNEFHNRLVLVTIGSKKTVPLSGFRKGSDIAPGRWTPVFAKR